MYGEEAHVTEYESPFGGAPFEGDGWDLAEVLWVPGVDYVGAWRAAKAEADALNAVFAAAGLVPEVARAVAVSDADGGASVQIHATVPAARRLAALIASTGPI